MQGNNKKKLHHMDSRATEHAYHYDSDEERMRQEIMMGDDYDHQRRSQRPSQKLHSEN